MTQKTMQRRRMRALQRGRMGRVGIWESLGLRLAGLLDGARGLPRQGGSSNWNSPFLHREISSYEEYCSRMWSLLQMEREQEYIRLNELLDSLPALRAQIFDSRGELWEAGQKEIFTARKKGEEQLSDDQIFVRRSAERKRMLAPMEEALKTMEDRYAAELSEFTATCSRLEEDENTIRMATQRVREHTCQRLAIYWNAALRRHPESNAMPAAPCVALTARAEAVYTELHRTLMTRALALRLEETEAA